LHHATIVDEHEQRVHRMKMEAKRIAGEQPDHAKGHWAQLRVSAPAPSLRDFAFAVRLAASAVDAIHRRISLRYCTLSQRQGSPDGPERLSIGLFQAATTNEDDGYLKELTQLKPPADAVP
jgi:hypothetical protein